VKKRKKPGVNKVLEEYFFFFFLVGDLEIL
jgi:hypothetical protein